MRKIYFNHVSGNRYEGYPLKYVNENNEEFDLIVTPSINPEFGNIHRLRLVNCIPYKFGINTILTPSGVVETAEDMSFFDPMSVGCIQRSIPWKGNNTSANYALAFPGMVSGDFVVGNHHLSKSIGSNSNRNYSIFPNVSWNYYGDPNETSLNSVVLEEFKKDLFTIGESTNIEAFESQYGMPWNEICNDEYLSGISWLKYVISSNDDVIDSYISLSYGRKDSPHFLADGPEFSSPNYNNPKYSETRVEDSKFYGGIEDTWNYSYNGNYEKISQSEFVPEVNYSEGLPSSTFKFIDEIFLISDTYRPQLNLMLPIFNDNNTDEYYFVLFYSSATLPAMEPPYIDLKYMGKTRLYKNEEKKKWILDFATPFKLPTYGNKSSTYLAGHYECDSSIDPWKGEMLLNYVNSRGELTAEKIRLWKYNKFNSSTDGIAIPEFLGDTRFSESNYVMTTGIHIRNMNQNFYPDNFFKENNYVCTDSGSYTILI